MVADALCEMLSTQPPSAWGCKDDERRCVVPFDYSLVPGSRGHIRPSKPSFDADARRAGALKRSQRELSPDVPSLDMDSAGE